MTTYTTLTDTALSQDKPVTQSMTRAWRDNPIAIAEGAANSPVIVGVNPTAVSTVTTAVAALIFTSLPLADLIDIEIFNLRPVTSGAALQCQVSTNGGSTWINSNYAFVKSIAEFVSGTATTAGEGGSGLGAFNISQTSGGVSNGSSNGVSGTFQLMNPASVTLLKTALWHLNHWNSSSSGIVNVNGSGTFGGVATGTAINAIKFFYSTGNISAGQITVRPRRAASTN